MKPTIEGIKSAVLSVLEINEDAFLRARKSRLSYFIRAKQIICYIARNVGYTSATIGNYLNIGHSVVLYHEKVAKNHMELERDFEEDVSRAFEKLGVLIPVDSITGWVVRDSEAQGENLLFFVGRKPNRDIKHGIWKAEDDYIVCEIPKKILPRITWEDEAHRCELTLRLK